MLVILKGWSYSLLLLCSCPQPRRVHEVIVILSFVTFLFHFTYFGILFYVIPRYTYADCSLITLDLKDIYLN